MPNSLDFFRSGGFFMLPLILTCILGVAAAIFKFLTLAPKRIAPPALVRDLAASLSPEWSPDLVATLADGQSTLARLAHLVYRNRAQSRESLTQLLESHAKREIHQLHAGMALLDVVMTIAPLLGLLGTVSGLVVAFQGLSNQSNMVTIAAGIAEALHTTIFGIAIAVVAIVAHSFFSRKIETACMLLETSLEQLILSHHNAADT